MKRKEKRVDMIVFIASYETSHDRMIAEEYHAIRPLPYKRDKERKMNKCTTVCLFRLDKPSLISSPLRSVFFFISPGATSALIKFDVDVQATVTLSWI